MNQQELTSLFSERPQNFLWFLGAGTSRTSGLPTATDLLWKMKRTYYCVQENQRVSLQDLQNEDVKDKIQSFVESQGFPKLWAEDEYSLCFEKIFGDDRERQRAYIKKQLSEDNVSLSVGNRALAALIVQGLSRVVFTTNFDSVVEKSVAEIGQDSLSAFHLEGSHSAKRALDNEEYPIYCKLHGDFRYDSIKNISSDLAVQNSDLSDCFINAASRSGIIVVGYSGRDESVIDLFVKVLEKDNPFPHGLFWTGLKGSAQPEQVSKLIELAVSKGVHAEYVEIETFDTFLLRLWRNVENPKTELNNKVYSSKITEVDIPLPNIGRGKPLIRFNALPFTPPDVCNKIVFNPSKTSLDISEILRATRSDLIVSKYNETLCWGVKTEINRAFENTGFEIAEAKLPVDFQKPESLHVKGFIEEALCKAITLDKPLISRSSKYSNFIIAKDNVVDVGIFAPLHQVVGKTTGIIAGLFSEVDEFHLEREQVSWAEALNISVEYRNDCAWVLIEPDIWIWPRRSKHLARDFLDKRRRDRYNPKYDQLLSAWISIIFDNTEGKSEILLSAFKQGDSFENPSFLLGRRTAFSRRKN